jgi:hypothetical protein
MLPEWAETTVVNGCHVLYGGFNPRWESGAAERSIVNQLANKLGPGHAVVVPTWYSPVDVLEYIKQLDITSVYICSLTDPYGPIIGFSDQFECSVKYFGYTDIGIAYDFWAVICGKKFKRYCAEELLPTKFDYLFLNYNRKPHSHRINLVNALKEHNLFETGCVSLGGEYYINDSNSYVEHGANDVADSIEIPNDIYSLGRIDLWQQHFLNIVSETEFTPNGYFSSEKIWKPIIGLRPFIVNGNPKIYQWLQERGFDCFEDLFPVEKLKNFTNFNDTHATIINSLKNLQKENLSKLYSSIYNRLLSNKQLFNEYSSDQANFEHNFKW